MLSLKIVVLLFLWITIICSIIFATDLLWVKLILFIVAIGVSIHIMILKTFKDKKDDL